MAQARPLQPKVFFFDPGWNAERLGHYAKSYLYSVTLSKVTSSCPRGSCFLFLREALGGTKINPCHSQEHEATPALGGGLGGWGVLLYA